MQLSTASMRLRKNQKYYKKKTVIMNDLQCGSDIKLLWGTVYEKS